MAKQHPLEEFQLTGFTPSDMRAFTDSLINSINDDDTSRQTWLANQTLAYRRRFGLEDRGTDWPWPDASDIIMPTIDMTIDQFKSVATSSVFPFPTHERNVRFIPFRSELTDKARLDEQFFNWMQIFGMRDYRRHVIYAIDGLLQDGLAMMKTFWDLEIRTERKIYRRQDFLTRYAREIQQLTQAGAVAELQRNPQAAQNPQALAQTVSDRIVDLLALRIAEDLGLDPTRSETDRDSLVKILRFLKSGNPGQIEYQVEQVWYNLPRSVAVNPKDVIVNGRSSDIQYAPRVTHRLFLTEPMFLQKARDLKWDPEIVNAVLEAKKNPQTSFRSTSRTASAYRLADFDRDLREGITSLGAEGMIEVWETYFWHAPKKRGRPRRLWCTIAPGIGTKTGRAPLLKGFRPVPYHHGLTPFDVITFELIEDRLYAPRGVAAKLDDIDWEITLRHRSALNKMDMMVPMFTRLRGSSLAAEDVRFRPGRILDVSRHDEIVPMQIPDYTGPDIREELALLGWKERYLGGFDPLSSQENIREARTATETNALTTNARVMAAHRALVIQLGFSKVNDKQWDLFNQWGDPALYERITGEQFIPMSPEEIRQNFGIMMVGSTDTVSQQTAVQRAFERYQAALQLVQVNGGPVVNGTHFVDIGEAFRRWIQKDAPEDAPAIFRELTPEERQQIAQQQAERQEKQRLLEAAEDNEPLSPTEARTVVRELGKLTGRGGRQRILTGG